MDVGITQEQDTVGDMGGKKGLSKMSAGNEAK